MIDHLTGSLTPTYQPDRRIEIEVKNHPSGRGFNLYEIRDGKPDSQPYYDPLGWHRLIDVYRKDKRYTVKQIDARHYVITLNTTE